MIPGFLFGMFGGLVAGRVIAYRRWRRWQGGGLGGLRRGPVARWLVRDLQLTEPQQAEVEGILSRLRQSASGLRGGKGEDLGAVASAFGAAEFDRAAVEAVLERRGAALAGVKAEVLAGLARLHEVLTPQQRQRLQERLGGLLHSRCHQG